MPITELAAAKACPIGLHSAATERPDPPVDLEEVGRRLWRWFHQVMASFDRDKVHADAAARWLAEFTSQVPASTCTCQEDFRELLAQHPVPLDDRFAWSVMIHNLVNAKLGKRSDWMVNEARVNNLP